MNSLVKAALSAIAGLVLVLSAAAPAGAASPDRVQVSTDGVTWTSATTTGLFSDLSMLVPGGTTTATFYVKNGSSANAILRVGATPRSITPAAFASSLSLTIASSVARGVPVVLTPGDECVPLLDGPVLAPGAIATIAITAALDVAAPNEAQGGQADVALSVNLVEDTGGARPAWSCDESLEVPLAGGGSTTIASTGFTALYPALVVAAMLVSMGLVVVVFGRRRRSRQ